MGLSFVDDEARFLIDEVIDIGVLRSSRLGQTRERTRVFKQYRVEAIEGPVPHDRGELVELRAQMKYIAEVIKRNDNTRRASFYIGEEGRRFSGESVCIPLVSFTLRDGILHAFAFFRSCDVKKMYAGDLIAIATAVRELATILKVRATGWLDVYIASAHVYVEGK